MQDNITTHFSWDEVTRSTTANNLGIDNEITDLNDLAAITETAQCMERVRALLGVPCIVTSWYRNEAVNKAVGGVPTSQHRLGEAVDFKPVNLPVPDAIALLRASIKELEIDQLIQYAGHIHVSFITHPTKYGRNPRNQFIDSR